MLDDSLMRGGLGAEPETRNTKTTVYQILRSYLNMEAMKKGQTQGSQKTQAMIH
jgi:hypothetical protein